MWIKQPRDRRSFSRLVSTPGPARVVVVALFVVALSLFAFLSGAYLHDEGYLYGGRQIVEANYRIPFNYLRGLSSRPPRLFIDIKFTDFQRLAYNRELALRRGGLLPDARDEVPATLRLDDQKIRARVRLKGDTSTHWSHPSKWSFRIELRGDATLLGMKEFSIQSPRARNFLSEWFLHRFLDFNDLVGLRHELLEVTVNGKDLGVYLLEEEYEKRLIERNRRREGPLFRADTRFYWYHRPGIAEPLFGTAVDAFQSKRLAAAPILASQYRTARNLFEAFREGDLPTHRVFDVERLARLFAILDLIGEDHGASLDNVVFYFNPVTARIEAVCGDGGRIRPLPALVGSARHVELPGADGGGDPTDWEDLVFRDPIFFDAYIRELERISDPTILEEFFRAHDAEYRDKLRVLHRDFPWYSFEPNRQTLVRNQGFIRAFLSPVRSVQAYLSSPPVDGEAVELEAASIHALPVEIVALRYGDSGDLQPLERTTLEAARPGAPPRYRRVRFGPPPQWTGEEPALRLAVRTLGASTVREEPVHSLPHRDPLFMETELVREEPNVETFDFVRVDAEGRLIAIEPGDWQLDRSLIVPAGYRVLCRAGTRLRLVGASKILSYSALDFRGSADDPIVIEGADGSDAGLVVIGAADPSWLEHVHFVNLAQPIQGSWELTGAVTFYESPVTFANCVFRDNRSEDALNILRSPFAIEDTRFENTSADALDIDFGEGTIVRSAFVGCGNDGIDVSGTRVELADLLFDQAGDKGLSAGERSSVRGSRIRLRQAEVAVAAKDMSEMDLESVEIEDSRVGLTAYQKKEEFGPARISARGLTLTGVEMPFIVERQSAVTVDGRAIAATHDNVADDLMYGAEFGKSSD